MLSRNTLFFCTAQYILLRSAEDTVLVSVSPFYEEIILLIFAHLSVPVVVLPPRVALLPPSPEGLRPPPPPPLTSSTTPAAVIASSVLLEEEKVRNWMRV